GICELHFQRYADKDKHRHVSPSLLLALPLMDSHGNTSEEATSARGTRSAADLVSEVEVTGYDTT
ncbi:hypothetical protein BHE74_00026997, partial [Ensete ventricosum]